ncbi:MAG TPA: T9SS type A sorting domain-containing protein [Ignavibacteria bacterium]|nr:T9SS type A sorting domain-containing protein [Ignavibacteria bacterium]
MNSIIKILTLVLSINLLQLYSQELIIQDNPYEKADDYTKTKKSFNRERWFYEQRMFPNNYLPDDAYGKAIEQRNSLRNINGFAFDNAVTWTSIGPTSGFYFSYSNISGRVTTVKYDPVNPSIIYIGAAFGGVWKSTNGGNSFTPITDNELSMSSGSIVVDPSNTNIVYYGSGEATYSGASYYGRGIFKSTNGGSSWINITSGLPSLTYCSRLVIRPGFSNQLLAAMGTSGLYRSTDAGLTWVQLVSGRCDDVIFAPNGTNAYIVGSGTGYRTSTDGGATFVQNATLTMSTRNHIAICKNTPSVLYCAVHGGSTITTYKSTNSGLNFSQVASGHNFDGGQAWYDFYMHVNPFDPNYAYVGSIDIWRTTNGGTSFQNITNGYSGGSVHVDQHNMDFNPVNSNELMAVNDGGVWKSTDRGTTWINLNAGLTLTQFYRIAADPSNVNHVMGGTQDNGTQRTLGTVNWTAAFGGDGGEVCFHPQSSQFILGETQNNGVQRSQNGGNGWQSATSGLTGSGAWVGPIIAHPTTAGIFYTARQQVFQSTNWGASWSAISGGTSGTIREMAISRTDPSLLYATSSSLIFKSTNSGVNFSNVTTGLPSRTITSVSIHPDSSQVAIVTYSGFGAGKVYKTTNGGTTWNNISGNLPDSPVNDALIYYPGTSTSILYAAMDVGVFFTSNFGASWVELADGLPNTVAMHLDYHQATNRLRIGTHGRGVWETSNPVGLINYNNQVPSNFSLQQNYPNPFNPVTTIKYDILTEGFVKLAVYDILGRELKSIISQNQKPGTYTVQFDGSNLSSGVYFYKLQANGFTETKKMMITK